MFGVNPWKFMQWTGHERVDETMLHVPEIIAILDARRLCETATPKALTDENRKVLVR
jgi:hypothetical protein